MEGMFQALLLSFVLFHQSNTANGQGFQAHTSVYNDTLTATGREQWGYTTVRPGAHMFWWMYYTTHPDGYLQRPWIIWLQGGPGLSSVGFGNFLEIGILDEKGVYRETNWVQEASVLFIDSPVGAGFSFKDPDASYAVTIETIAEDILSFLQVFVTDNPEFKLLPLYLFGQSYGGKTTPVLGSYIVKATKAGQIECNLKGVAIGNGFVSPADIILGLSSVMYHVSLLDWPQYKAQEERVEELRRRGIRNASVMETLGRELWGELWNVPAVNAYNMLDLESYWNGESMRRRRRRETDWSFPPLPGSIYDRVEEISNIMNDLASEKLRSVIPPYFVSFGASLMTLYRAQEDFFSDSIHYVDDLLMNSNVQVIVYSGTLDLICHTPATNAWIQRLKWSGLSQFNNVIRTPLGKERIEMFVKVHDRLKFYWIPGSGHTVPVDVPHVALRMLRRILEEVDT